MLACCLCKGGDATVTHLLQYCGGLLVTIVILVWHALVMPRMVVFILGSFSGPYGVSLWKILEGGGTLYLGLLCMKLEMDQKCNFG